MRQKSAVKMAQEVLAKKWGLLNSDRDLEEITLQQYMDLYKKLLSQLAVVVVHKLTKVTEMKKKKMVAKKEGTKSKSKASLLKADVHIA
jgi:site-specific recombinase XerC